MSVPCIWRQLIPTREHCEWENVDGCATPSSLTGARVLSQSNTTNACQPRVNLSEACELAHGTFYSHESALAASLVGRFSNMKNAQE